MRRRLAPPRERCPTPPRSVTTTAVLLWIHFVVLVFLVGYALFWTIVAVPRAGTGPQADRALLRSLRALRVPPFGPLRVPLPVLGWLGLVAAALTGIASGQSDGGTEPTPLMTTFVTLAISFLACVLASNSTPTCGPWCA